MEPGRYFAFFRFHGSGLCGWQRQSNAIGVQQLAEEALEMVFGQSTPLVGAGRTDAGVHALMLPAHFDAGKYFDRPALLRSLNALLDPRISVFDIRAVHPEAHARFSAVKRTYRYRLHFRKDPFLADRSLWLPKKPDFERMQSASSELIGTRDFSSFARSGGSAKHHRCTVDSAHWFEDGDEWVFEISADRFLRNMVRAIVGTLLEIGQGKRSERDLSEVFDFEDRRKAGESAAAHGLFLHSVAYPSEIFIANEAAALTYSSKNEDNTPIDAR